MEITKKPILKTDNQGSTYPILYLSRDLDSELFDYGKTFHTFKNQDGDKTLFKQTPNDIFALSEVFHSKAAVILGEPTAENELAIRAENLGVASKVFTEPNDFVFDINATMPFGAHYKHKNEYRSTFPLFQNLNLEKFINEKLQNEEAGFVHEFIRTWLTSNVFANTDQLDSHNAKFIYREQGEKVLKFMFPNFDYEQCMFFLDKDMTSKRQKEVSFLQQGFEPNNIAFLKEKYPKIINDYFERLLSLKTDPKFIDICDFTGLEKFLAEAGITQNEAQTKNTLQRLSERVHSGYKGRIDLLTKDIEK